MSTFKNEFERQWEVVVSSAVSSIRKAYNEGNTPNMDDVNKVISKSFEKWRFGNSYENTWFNTIENKNLKARLLQEVMIIKIVKIKEVYPSKLILLPICVMFGAILYVSLGYLINIQGWKLYGISIIGTMLMWTILSTIQSDKINKKREYYVNEYKKQLLNYKKQIDIIINNIDTK